MAISKRRRRTIHVAGKDYLWRVKKNPRFRELPDSPEVFESSRALDVSIGDSRNIL